MSIRQNKLTESVLREPNWESQHGCDVCPVGQFCLPAGLPLDDCVALNKLMYVSRAQEAGRPLVHAGDPLQALYAVRAGCFKSVSVDPDGNERVVDFHLPSELIGLDAIYSGSHLSEVIAVTVGKVCIFPYKSLLDLASSSPELLNSWLKSFSKNLLAQLAHGVDNTADQRLAGFLLRLSLRLPMRGELNDRFLLPMSRIDLASHLRVANGTLSRVIARLQGEGMIRVDDRLVEIVDFDSLRRAAGVLADISL